MIKFGVYTRNVILNKPLRQALTDFITDDPEAAPGQLRQKGDWLYLTYLRAVKLKRFDPRVFGPDESEVDCVRAVAFRFRKNKLLVQGGKSEIKEIKGLFDALALQLAGGKGEDTFNYDQYYKLEPTEVDLGAVLKSFEGRGLVESVRKLRVRDLEVKLGSIRNCIVNTSDYGAVRKLLSEIDHKVVGVEIALREPERTFVYVDIDGQVRIASAGADDELDLEKMALDIATRL